MISLNPLAVAQPKRKLLLSVGSCCTSLDEKNRTSVVSCGSKCPNRHSSPDSQVWLLSHRIHVWYIYLHLVDFHGKYAIHASYGYGLGNKKVLIFEVAEQRFAFTDVHDVPWSVDGYRTPLRLSSTVYSYWNQEHFNRYLWHKCHEWLQVTLHILSLGRLKCQVLMKLQSQFQLQGSENQTWTSTVKQRSITATQMAPWHGPNDSKHQGSQLRRHQSWDQWMPIVHALPCFPARGRSQHERIKIVLEALQSHHWLDECGQHMAKILTDVSDLQHVSPTTHYTAQTTTTVSAILCWLTHVHNKTSMPNMSLQLVSTDKHLYCWWKKYCTSWHGKLPMICCVVCKYIWIDIYIYIYTVMHINRCRISSIKST